MQILDRYTSPILMAAISGAFLLLDAPFLAGTSAGVAGLAAALTLAQG